MASSMLDRSAIEETQTKELVCCTLNVLRALRMSPLNRNDLSVWSSLAAHLGLTNCALPWNGFTSPVPAGGCLGLGAADTRPPVARAARRDEGRMVSGGERCRPRERKRCNEGQDQGQG